MGVAVDLGVRVGASFPGVVRELWAVLSLSKLGSGLGSSCESGVGLGLVKEVMPGDKTFGASGAASGTVGLSVVSSWNVSTARFW